MGYAAQHWASEDPQFRKKLKTALYKLAEPRIDNADLEIAAMAKAIVRRPEEAAVMLALDMALAGLDVDSTDAAIDTELAKTATLDILKVLTGAVS